MAAKKPRPGDVEAIEIRQPVTAAKFIIKRSLFVQLLGVIHRQVLKQISEQKNENLFVCRHTAKPPVGGWASQLNIANYFFISSSKLENRLSRCLQNPSMSG